MIAMSKEKMIQYLKDYSNIQSILVQHPNVPIGTAFDNYMISNGRYEDATREYYDRMRRVYVSYMAFKDFSIIEDYLLNRDDFLSNNDLNGIESDCKIITSPQGLTNKKIVQLIRNAFNHNDSLNIDRFKMSENARNFEIEFADIRTEKEIANGVKPKPVKIKFNMDYLMKVDKIINSKRQHQFFVSFDIPDSFDVFSENLDSELDKIKIVHYYFTKKMPNEAVEKFDQLANIKGLTGKQLYDRSTELHSFADSISKPIEFTLDEFQKRKLKELISEYKMNCKDGLSDENIIGTMFYFLYKTIPIPGLKQRDIEQHGILCEGYYADTSLSIDEISKRVLRVLEKGEIPLSYDDFDIEVHTLLNEKPDGYIFHFYKNIMNGEFMLLQPIITYIESVVMHYCTDNHIEIAGKLYDREKIRNSFAHNRWYISHDYKLTMFDADPRNINDYNLEFVGSISIGAFGRWADDYMGKSKIEKRHK